MSQFTW